MIFSWEPIGRMARAVGLVAGTWQDTLCSTYGWRWSNELSAVRRRRPWRGSHGATFGPRYGIREEYPFGDARKQGFNLRKRIAG
jgi:hypothetical protein